MSHSGDIDVVSIGTQLYLKCLLEQYFPVNFHFLKNNKGSNRDFFTIDTIDHGLSFHNIEGVLSSNIFRLVPYTIFRRYVPIDKARWSNQRDGPG